MRFCVNYCITWAYLLLFIGGLLGAILWRKNINDNTRNNMRVLKSWPRRNRISEYEDFRLCKESTYWLELHYADANIKIEDIMVHKTNMSRTAFYTSN